MKSFVFGALLLRTLDAQSLSSSAVSSTDSSSVTLAPLLIPGPDAPNESLFAQADAFGAQDVDTSSQSPLPIGTADVVILETPSALISALPTLTSSISSVTLSINALAASDTATSGSLGSNIGAQAFAGGANFGSSFRPGGGDDAGSYDGQDYGDDWDDGQTAGAADGTDSYGSGEDVHCPADCTCVVQVPEEDSHEGYPPPPGYSPPPMRYTPTAAYSPEPTPDYEGGEGGDDGYDPYAASASPTPYARRKVGARQAASGGFAGFNWPGATDDSGDGASDTDDLPDWLYDSAGVVKHKPICPKACCNKHTGGYPSQSTGKYPIDSAPTYSRGPMPGPTGYVDPAYNSNHTTSEAYAPTWTTLMAPAASADYTGDTLAGICPKTCNPKSDKNYCDITSSCTTTGGSKNYCACRAGYMASAWNAKDFSKQFIVDGQPFVYVAPGVVCDKLCDGYACKDVLTRPKCA